MTTDLKPSYPPAELVATVANLLGTDLADADTTKAFLSASSLLLSLGVEPDIPQHDHSVAAEMVRGLMVEHATRTTTRPRRAL